MVEKVVKTILLERYVFCKVCRKVLVKRTYQGFGHIPTCQTCRQLVKNNELKVYEY